MDKKTQNILILILLATGLIAFFHERNKPEPASEEALREEIRQALEEDLEEGRVEEAPGLDEQALRESIRAELLEELQKMEAPVPTVVPESPEAAAEEPPEPVFEASPPEPPEPVPTSTSPPARPSSPPEVTEQQLELMQRHLEELKVNITAMRRIIQEEERALQTEKNRILRWKASVRNTYQNELFSVTKTRAEIQRIRAAENNWRSRKRRQDLRKQLLADAEQDLQFKTRLYQEARRS